MKNQFIYTQKDKEGKDYKGSFNINKVIRSLEDENGTLIVILDDFNERVLEQPDIDTRTNKMKGMKKVRQTIQSEIVLFKEDKERFFNLTNIE